MHNVSKSPREKCPNTEFFSGLYFPVFGLNTENTDTLYNLAAFAARFLKCV